MSGPRGRTIGAASVSLSCDAGADLHGVVPAVQRLPWRTGLGSCWSIGRGSGDCCCRGGRGCGPVAQLVRAHA